MTSKNKQYIREFLTVVGAIHIFHQKELFEADTHFNGQQLSERVYKYQSKYLMTMTYIVTAPNYYVKTVVELNCAFSDGKFFSSVLRLIYMVLFYIYIFCIYCFKI